MEVFLNCHGFLSLAFLLPQRTIADLDASWEANKWAIKFNDLSGTVDIKVYISWEEFVDFIMLLHENTFHIPQLYEGTPTKLTIGFRSQRVSKVEN